jgi:tRNASer (uridine44-2'-O)-methyltransferase
MYSVFHFLIKISFFLPVCNQHQGLGIDLRKRNIWDTFGSSDLCRLEEKSIMPSAESLFPDWDWIIGNHSDELTPWIPVIAAR